MRIRIVRLRSERPGEPLLCLAEPAGPRVCHPERVERLRIGPAVTVRLLGQLDRLIMVADLLGHEPEVSQGVRVCRLVLQDLRVHLVRLLQSAGSVMFYCQQEALPVLRQTAVPVAAVLREPLPLAARP